MVKSNLNSAPVKLKERRSLKKQKRRVMGSSQSQEGFGLQLHKTTHLLYLKAKEHPEV